MTTTQVATAASRTTAQNILRRAMLLDREDRSMLDIVQLAAQDETNYVARGAAYEAVDKVVRTTSPRGHEIRLALFNRAIESLASP